VSVRSRIPGRDRPVRAGGQRVGRGGGGEGGAPGGGAGRGGPSLPLGRLATGGFEFAVTILLGLALGRWLDRRAGTAPWLLILGVFIGAAGGFYSLYRAL